MNTKKLISLALSVCMVSTAGMAVVTADAASSKVDVSVADTSVKAGEQVEIAVNATIPEPGAAGFEFAVSYDPSFMKITAVKEGTLIATGASDAEIGANGDLSDTMISGSSYSCLDYVINDDGTVAVMWTTGLEDQKYWAKGEGTVITLVATIDANATGSSKVGIESIRSGGNVKFGYVDYTAGSEVAYDVTANAGTISVGGAEETTTTTATTEEQKPDDTTTTTTSEVTLPEATLLGDATCDGFVDVRDVTSMCQHIVKLNTLSGQGFTNADVQIDGVVDVKDLSQLKKFLVGGIASL